MNSRAPGIAIWEGVVTPVYEALMGGRHFFLQLPCPEAVVTGLRRWWYVREQYDNSLFREVCRDIAVASSEILLENRVYGFKLLGLGLSPSCGYRETQSDPSWGGRPREVDVSANVKPGMGVWIGVLRDVFSEYGFKFSVYDLPPSILYPKGRAEHTHLYPKDVAGGIRELYRELGYGAGDVGRYLAKASISRDVRSGKVLVLPQEVVMGRPNAVNRYVSMGFGLVVIPRSNVVNHDRVQLTRYVTHQLINHSVVGHKVLVATECEHSRLYEELLKRVRDSGLYRYVEFVEL